VHTHRPTRKPASLPAAPRPTEARLQIEPLEAREAPSFGLDASFGLHGVDLNPVGSQVHFDHLTNLAVLGNGDLLTAGNLPGSGDIGVVSLTATGAPDPLFGGGDALATIHSTAAHDVHSVAVQADGKILLAGDVAATGGGHDFFVMRLNADGTTDTTFGTAGEADVNIGQEDALGGLTVQADGKIVLAGSTTPGSVALARLNADGTPDAGFGTAGEAVTGLSSTVGGVAGAAVGADGKIVVAATIGNELGVLRYNPDGTADTTFSGDGTAMTHFATVGNVADSMALLPDGRVVVGGATQDGHGLLAWFDATGGVLAQENLSAGAPAHGAVTGVIPATTGGVELIGNGDPASSTAGYFFEYRGAPGVSGGFWQVDLGAGATAPGAEVFQADGKLVTSGLQGGQLAVTRLGSPGLSLGAPTFVEPLTPGAPQPAGQPVNLQVGVRPVLGPATIGVGTVTFSEGATVLGTATPNAQGIATFAATLAPGSHTIAAAYSGTSAWSASSATFPVVVSTPAATTTTLAASSIAPEFGSLLTLTATVAPQAGAPIPTGTVTFYDGTTVLGAKALDATGKAVFSSAKLAVGAHSLHATYSGDTASLGSQSTNLAVNVTAARTGIVLSAPATPVLLGQPVTLTATVRALNGGSTPTGTMTFMEGTRVLGTAVIDSHGQAKLTLTNLSVGIHVVVANYTGPVSWQASSSGAARITVTSVSRAATTTTLSSSVAVPVAGQDQTLTAVVSGPAGRGVPTGRVYFYDNLTLIGSALLDATGRARLTVRLAVGWHPLRAVYPGSTLFLSSKSTWLTEMVQRASTTVSLSASSTRPAVGANVTFMALVKPRYSGAPTGTVTFKEGTRILGTAVVSGGGLGTLTTTFTTAGLHLITATYAGNGSFLGATSPLFNVTAI
jgi:uncharacterized delta-60 repeat protein